MFGDDGVGDAGACVGAAGAGEGDAGVCTLMGLLVEGRGDTRAGTAQKIAMVLEYTQE